MSTNRRGDTSWVTIVIGAVVALFIYLLWQFSTFFGLDMDTGASVFIRLLMFVAFVGASWWLGNDYEIIRLSNIWPIVLALFWACWWPALDYWSAGTGLRFSAPAYGRSSPGPISVDTVWWAAWYTKWGILVAILGLGYFWKRVFQSDY